MEIVILDGYTLNPGDLTWNKYEELGILTVYDRTTEDLIVKRIENAEIVLTNKTPITKETIDKCHNLKYIGVLATGYNIVDINYAKEKDIIVTNIPTYGTAAVAQYAIALLLEICHHIGDHSLAVKNGAWTNNKDWCFWNYPLVELEGKTMGIIGYGRIGRATGKIAEALGMNVLANNSSNSNNTKIDSVKFVDLDTLFKESDVISLHCPLLPSTVGIINKNSISKMKDGVIIINDSRGPLIVEKDLADALNSGKVRAAACDVVSTEPIRKDNPLLNAKNIIITPHIAWAPIESRQRLMDISFENLKQYLNSNPVNAVNLK